VATLLLGLGEGDRGGRLKEAFARKAVQAQVEPMTVRDPWRIRGVWRYLAIDRPGSNLFLLFKAVSQCQDYNKSWCTACSKPGGVSRSNWNR
jgi:hypothetical protein